MKALKIFTATFLTLIFSGHGFSYENLANSDDQTNYFEKILKEKKIQELLINEQLMEAASEWEKLGLGHGEGNGGDHIRGTFIKMGKAAIKFLFETQTGAMVLAQYNLDIEKIKNSLLAERIKVVDQILIDNGGSVVDAIGVPGMILLNRDSWINHFEKERDVYYLVFHEMLRSSAVNDDDFLISDKLQGFPDNLKVKTKVMPLFPLIKGQLLDKLFNAADIQTGGNGCPSSKDHNIDFDFENNTLEIIPGNFYLEAGVGSPKKVDRKSCQLAAPFKGIKGKRIIITQVEMKGKVHITKGARSKVSFEAFTAGSQGKKKTQQIKNPQETDILGRALVRQGANFKSACGKGGNLRLNSSASLVNSRGKSSHILMDKVKIYLTLEDC